MKTLLPKQGNELENPSIAMKRFCRRLRKKLRRAHSECCDRVGVTDRLTKPGINVRYRESLLPTILRAERKLYIHIEYGLADVKYDFKENENTNLSHGINSCSILIFRLQK